MDNVCESSASFEEEWQKYTVEEVLTWNHNHPHLEIINSFLKRYKQKNIKIVDGGSGIGRLVIYFQRKGYTVLGIEFVYSALLKAKKYEHTLPLAQGDLRKLPFANNSFDMYLSVGVIEHDIEGPDKILQETKRILKPKGLLFISIPIMNNFYKIFKPFIKFSRILFIENVLRKILRKPLISKKEFHYYLYNRSEFETIIKRNGFNILFLSPTMHIPGVAKACPLFLNRGKDKDTTGNSIYFLNRVGRIVYYCTKQFSWLFPNCCFIIAENMKE